MASVTEASCERDESLWEVWNKGPLHQFFVGKWAATAAPAALRSLHETVNKPEANEAEMKAMSCADFLKSSEAEELLEKEKSACCLVDASMFSNTVAIGKVMFRS